MSTVSRNSSTMIPSGLVSEAPTGQYAQKMHPFEKLIGDWELKITNIPLVGPPTTCDGTWHFGWGLNSRAVLDVWTVPGVEQGLTVRFFDPKVEGWRSIWLGATNATVALFVGRYIDGEIVLANTEHPDELSNWIFSRITKKSFQWRSETSNDNGHTWRVDQTMKATRTITT